jgi:hypothetical protein
LLQAVVDNGGKSPGMKILAVHPRQQTILKGFRLSAATDIAQPHCNIWPYRDKYLRERSKGYFAA